MKVRTAHFAIFEAGKEPRAPGLESVFALRYQVYCLDRKFLPAERYPNGLERDEFDQFSSHFCAVDKNARAVGAVRLVCPPAGRAFPFQQKFGDLADVDLPPNALAAEVSRLVVDRNYHRRAGDLPEGVPLRASNAEPLPGRRERRANKPEIVLGLYRAMYQHSRRRKIRYWYAAMERSLARALMRYHFQFHRIGPDADYFGPVALYLASLDDLERGVEEASPSLLRWFREN